MSGDFDRAVEDYSIINAMLPRVYHPPLQGNLYERRAASITRQLFNSKEFGIDYDQCNFRLTNTSVTAPAPSRPHPLILSLCVVHLCSARQEAHQRRCRVPVAR